MEILLVIAIICVLLPGGKKKGKPKANKSNDGWISSLIVGLAALAFLMIFWKIIVIALAFYTLGWLFVDENKRSTNKDLF